MSFSVDALQESLSTPSLGGETTPGAMVRCDPIRGLRTQDQSQFAVERGCPARVTTTRDKATPPNTAGHRGRYCLLRQPGSGRPIA